MPIIRPAGNGRELVMAGWGLVPFWLKPDQLAKQPYSTINARAETIQTAPTYREPFKKRRCLVPASGWYEWQKLDEKGKKKRPYHFKPKAEPFALAGVYDVWRGDGGRAITSFAIVTTDAAPSVKQYHHRMPVVLDDAQFDDWMRGTPESGGGDDEALCRRDRGLGGWPRCRQRAEQSAGTDGSSWAALG